jgi:hypothetical protein
MQKLEDRIQDRLNDLRAEIQQLENAKDALMDGQVNGRRRRRHSAGASQNGSVSRRRRRRAQRMDPRESESQALYAIREAGGDGLSISDLAEKVGVSGKCLASRILPPLNAQVIRTRGRVAAMT